MALLHDRFPGFTMGHLPLGTGPTPVRRLDMLGLDAEVWLKEESTFGDGRWGGNKVRKLEWIIPEAHRRKRRTLFTVGGIGTHWGLAAALYGAEHDLRTVLGLVDQPVDDHVRDQLRRLADSGAAIHRYPSVARLKLAAPWLLASNIRGGRPPWYLPAGGSNPVGTLAYVETALEIAAQVAAGDLPEPGTLVTASAPEVRRPASPSACASPDCAPGCSASWSTTRSRSTRPCWRGSRTGPLRPLLTERGAGDLPRITPADLTTKDDWLGSTYGDPTPASLAAVALAGEREGLTLEPVYTGKALAAVRDLDAALDGPVMWLNTHGPR